MNDASFSKITVGLAAAGPLLLLLFGLLPGAWLNRHSRRAARAGAWLALLGLGLTAGAVLSRALFGPARLAWPVSGPVELSLQVDNLAVIVLALVSFLLAVVTRFTVNYLAGEPRQGEFTKWICFTGGAVLTVVVSGNLLQFAVAWCATSLGLHRLLVFYPTRPGAQLAARKKFIISRLGDLCLLAVIILVYHQFRTWDFAALFAAARQWAGGDAQGGRASVQAIALLLIVGAMLKSAQFPFHSWLPDTMETPTPVSALMHAGIINAGGYLILRLHPLVILSPGAMSVLAFFGAFTALFASLVMLTHASVKRSLAFSTVAQMGFMMLECGLGAFALATLHLVAHSLYKAHAFLSSGSVVRLAKSAWTPTDKPGAHPFVLGAALGLAASLVLGGAWMFHLDWRHDAGQFVLATVFAMALAYLLWMFWGRGLTPRLAMFGALLGAGIVAGLFTLHLGFNRLLDEGAWQNTQLNTWAGAVVASLVLGLFLAVLLVQTEIPQWSNRPFFQALYVHARNGFYLNTLANRAVAAVWPVKSSSTPE